MEIKREKGIDVRIMVELAMAASLALVLSFIKLYEMPQGGSLSLEMVPVFYVAVRRGGASGLTTGMILGLGQLFFLPRIFYPAQIILDYPLAFTLLGVAGFLKGMPTIGVLVGCSLRYLCHFLSGVLFFAEYAPEGMNVWVYSALYNASYMIPETVITIIIIALILAKEREMRDNN